MKHFKPEGSKAKKRLVLLSCLSCLLVSIWYLNHSDTSDAPLMILQNESKTLHSLPEESPQLNTEKPLHRITKANQNTVATIEPGSTVEEPFPEQEKLLAKVMENFKEMEEVLENIDHPSVQEFMAALPPESQKSLKLAALKQSVSKRLDIVEANPLSPIDLKHLNQDIDKLADNFVMMPEEARNLKAYLQQRTKS